MTPSSDAFEDESDWIQVADESFDSSICCLESISVSRKLDDASFRATSNGSIVFDALSQPVRRVGTQDSSEESEDQNRSQQSIEERFQVLEKLGEGSYGVVFKAKDRRTNEIFAIKKLRIDTEPLRRRHFVNEMLALRVLQEDGSNQNIVKFIDAYSCQREQAVGIIFEYMDGGSLGNILAKNGAIDDEIVLAYICSECLSGLKYIHSMNMIHRDIKPENLLINSKSRIKLSDFGLAKIINRKMKKRASTFVGTLNYMAPERCV
jgi:serine/threonine protein kinase